MPLIPATLKTDLIRWMDAKSATPVDSAAMFLDAIGKYASTAMVSVIPATPAGIEVGKAAAYGVIVPAFTSGTPVGFTTGVSSGLSAFWTAMAPTGFPTSTLVVAVPTPLQAALTPALAAGMAGSPTSAIADIMTSAIQAWTILVMVTIPVGPVLTPFPIV